MAHNLWDKKPTKTQDIISLLLSSGSALLSTFFAIIFALFAQILHLNFIKIQNSTIFDSNFKVSTNLVLQGICIIALIFRSPQKIKWVFNTMTGAF